MAEGKAQVTGKNGKTKNKVVAGVLGILFGWLGGHKFYLGFFEEGGLMLAMTVIGFLLSYSFPEVPIPGAGIAEVMMIIGIVEGIIYLTDSPDQFRANYIDDHKGWF